MQHLLLTAILNPKPRPTREAAIESTALEEKKIRWFREGISSEFAMLEQRGHEGQWEIQPQTLNPFHVKVHCKYKYFHELESILSKRSQPQHSISEGQQPRDYGKCGQPTSPSLMHSDLMQACC
jgi:hypothetical protein